MRPTDEDKRLEEIARNCINGMQVSRIYKALLQATHPLRKQLERATKAYSDVQEENRKLDLENTNLRKQLELLTDTFFNTQDENQKLHNGISELQKQMDIEGDKIGNLREIIRQQREALVGCELVLDVLYTFHRNSAIWQQFKITEKRDAARKAISLTQDSPEKKG